MKRISLQLCVILAIAGGVGMPGKASAALPPFEVAVAAMGSDASTRDLDWEVQRVQGETLQTLTLESREEEKVVFRAESASLDVSAEGEEPWAFVGAMLFADELEGLEIISRARFEGPRRVENLGGSIAFCYGAEERVCFDRELRSMLLVEVQIDGSLWSFRRRGQSLQVSEDGALRARFRGK